jgi:hypothetical protein
MYTTYHLSSAQEVNSDILEAIKATFKTKAITIIVEESDVELDISNELKNILDERLIEDESTYLSSEDSIQQLKDKYGV